MHDNNSGDAAFTAYFKYHSDGRQSEIHDAEVDRLITAAGEAQGAEREDLYQEAFRRIYEDLVADVPLFHMVNYMRVGPRLDFTPTIANAVELQLSQLTLKSPS
jgi:peptide/nickel transport system substrate-binding protein